MKTLNFVFALFLTVAAAFYTQADELATKLETIKSPVKKVAFLISKRSQYSDDKAAVASNYWRLLGLSYEENEQLSESIIAYDKSIELLEPFKQEYPSQYVKTLIDRSYTKYLQSYDVASYCPDRKLAYDFIDSNISIDLKVRVLVQYSFCFKNDKSMLSEGLSLLDRALKLAQEHNLIANTHGMIYNALGSLYQKNQLYKQSYQYLLNAYQHWASVDDVEDMFNMQFTLTNVAIELLELDKAQGHVEVMFSLANANPQHGDFLFFANLNAGIVAVEEKRLVKGISYYEKALSLEEKTSEVYFVIMLYEQLINQYFNTQQFEKSEHLLALLAEKHPQHRIKSPKLLSIKAYLQEDYQESYRQLSLAAEHEKRERKLFLKHATQATSLLNRKNVAELDKKLLTKTIEVQSLELRNQQIERNNIYIILLFAGVALTALVIFSYYLFKTRRYFIHHARIDHLTQIYNRRFLLQQGQRFFEKSVDCRNDVMIMIFDIDNFKVINDTQGHALGDAVIKYVVSCCNRILPENKVFGRLGGDEFLIILPNTSSRLANKHAEEVRLLIHQQHEIEFKAIDLSISIGIVNASNYSSLDDAIAGADHLLYKAKEKGRNVVVCEDVETIED